MDVISSSCVLLVKPKLWTGKPAIINSFLGLVSLNLALVMLQKNVYIYKTLGFLFK